MHMITRSMRLTSTSLLIVTALAIAGCASPKKRTAIGSGAGAAAGAGIGAATGGWKGAAVGAVIGGVIGGAAGNLLDKRQEELQKVAETKKTADGNLLVELKNDILFDTDSTALQPAGRTQLSQLADILVKHPDDRITIGGYTDSVGNAKYNEDLSRRRGQVVRDVLTQRGANLSQIAVVGYGEKAPIASNATSEGRARNRRVTLNISIPEVQQAMRAEQGTKQQAGQAP